MYIICVYVYYIIYIFTAVDLVYILCLYLLNKFQITYRKHAGQPRYDMCIYIYNNLSISTCYYIYNIYIYTYISCIRIYIYMYIYIYIIIRIHNIHIYIHTLYIYIYIYVYFICSIGSMNHRYDVFSLRTMRCAQKRYRAPRAQFSQVLHLGFPP